MANCKTFREKNQEFFLNLQIDIKALTYITDPYTTQDIKEMHFTVCTSSKVKIYFKGL